MGSTAAIIIAIIAVVAGFLILKSIGDDDGGGSVSTPESTAAPIDTSAALTTAATVPVVTVATTPPIVLEGATVVVANASTVNGAAGVLTTALTGKGFTLAKATNATAKQEASTVLYDPADPEAFAVATSVATMMGNVLVQEITTPAPLEGGVVPEGVSVIVMLGSDKANSTLAQMSAPTTTVAGAVDTTTTTTG